jgi:hypothetical protein
LDSPGRCNVPLYDRINDPLVVRAAENVAELSRRAGSRRDSLWGGASTD